MTTDVLADVVLPRLDGVQQHGDRYEARCPAHTDNRASMSIERGRDHPVVFHCHAGCAPEDIADALNIPWADLCAPRDDTQQHGEWTPRGPATAVYPYVDETGALLYEVLRTLDKEFPARVPDPTAKHGYRWTMKGIRRVLYRLPQLLDAVAHGRPVYIVEGEKDVERLAADGHAATCNPGGAGKWKREYADHLVGADVVIVADNDHPNTRGLRPGLEHARQVAASLHGVAASIRVVQARTGKDAADHLAAGHGVDEFVPLDLTTGEPATPADPDAPAPLTDAEEALRLDRERRILEEVEKILVREEARRRARKQNRPTAEPPAVVPLDEFLSIPDQPQQYRITDLWPVGGRVMLAAQFKAGKTTLVSNLVRALVDGEKFLDRFDVDRPTGRVVIIDDELDERMVRSWLRDQGITNTAQAAVVSLRGRVSSFDILDPDIRTQWAKALREAGAEIVVLDCLAPIVDALGLSEDKEVGRLLVAFDELLGEAGVAEAVVVHHMGHNGERTRGASRLRDWPDVEWRLVREKADDGETDPAAPRYLSAYGRDVDVKESALTFDATTRRLRMGASSRKDAKYDRALDDICTWLADNPGASSRQIEAGLLHASDHTRPTLRAALKKGVRDGWLTTVPGARGAVQHWVKETPGNDRASAPERAASAPHTRRTENGLGDLQVIDQHESSAPSAPPEIGPKTHGMNSVRQADRRTQTPQNPSSEPSTDSVRRVRHDRAAQSGTSAPVRPPKGGGRTGAQRPGPGRPTWAADGSVIDSHTGEILEPAPVPCTHPRCTTLVSPNDGTCAEHH